MSAEVLSACPNLCFLISLAAWTFPGRLTELCARTVVLEEGFLFGCSGQWGEHRSAGRTGTQGVQQGLCWWLAVWPWPGCTQLGLEAKIYLWLHFFFFSQSQRENICFFYTFLVYLSWDLQFCRCCSVCFNSFEAFSAVFCDSQTLWLSALPVCQILSGFTLSWT